jgi:hypothetical protein
MPMGAQRATPRVAFVVAVLGAAAIMISPVTPWTLLLAVAGLVLLMPAAIVLIVWIIQHW